MGDDLEMVRKCALAAGIETREVSGNKPEHTIRLKDRHSGGAGNNYWPLTDDLQAFALVRKLGLSLNQQDADTDRWSAQWFDPDSEREISHTATGLNRAIVECCARLPALSAKP